jgi:hypothetical protein
VTYQAKGSIRDVMLGTPAAPPPSPVKLYGKNRNMPCPCGSGKKFKKCCLGKTQTERQQAARDATEQVQQNLKLALMGKTSAQMAMRSEIEKIAPEIAGQFVDEVIVDAAIRQQQHEGLHGDGQTE